MKTTPSIHDCPPSATPSGVSILLHSRFVQALGRIWGRMNNLARPLLPLLHLFMVVMTGVIFCAVVFANQRIPCWGDEICMLDPAYYRATTGIWHSASQWDSYEVIPFAPNYPLLINILRFLIGGFGFSFCLFRGVMLAFGLFPVAMLLWLLKRKGLLQSWGEACCAIYLTVCFTFCQWAIYIRPEALLVTVAGLLVYAWMTDRPVLLFGSALLVPLCGLQWNVLLLPAILHWLVFGGRIRNPFLVGTAFVLSSVITIAAYHLLGMWPSYLQEAARVGGLDAIHSASSKLHSAYASWDLTWLLHPLAIPPVVFLSACFSFALGGWGVFFRDASRLNRRFFFFLFFSFPAVILALALFGHMSWIYAFFLLAFLIPCLTALFCPLFHRPLVLLACALFALYPASVNWSKLSHHYAPHIEGLTDFRWNDELSLEHALRAVLTPEDIIACDAPAYPAIRALCKDLYPVCFAFDLSPDQYRSITAVLLEDHPSSILHKDGSGFRRAHYAETMVPRFCPPGGDPDSIRVSPEELLAAIGERWQCSFAEVPFERTVRPGFIRYRLFRPLFSADTANNQIDRPCQRCSTNGIVECHSF